MGASVGNTVTLGFFSSTGAKKVPEEDEMAVGTPNVEAADPGDDDGGQEPGLVDEVVATPSPKAKRRKRVVTFTLPTLALR